MKKETYKLFMTWTGLVLIFFLVSAFIMTFEHEEAHDVSCEYFNNKAGSWHVYFFHVETTCTGNMTQEYKLAQSFIDGFDYQLNAFFSGITLLIYSLGILLIMVRE